MTVTLVRGDAAHLPLPSLSVDLICTSPPYFALRSYQDNGGHYPNQIGSEATPAEFIDALIRCTAEWVRVLKPSGSLWVNLGDKYVADNRGSGVDDKRGAAKWAPAGPAGYPTGGMRQKSLMGLPWRYALRCIDDLGLILRAEVIWSKPNGLPESVTDRVRRSHEQWFHLTKQPRYYAAVDTIREPSLPPKQATASASARRIGVDGVREYLPAEPTARIYNPLGKLPGSVWSIPSQPLTVPPHLGVDHFAAFPMEWPRRLILGWSPSGICTRCGEGRRPVSVAEHVAAGPIALTDKARNGAQGNNFATRQLGRAERWTTVTGECCACTPYTDHPERRRAAGGGWSVDDNPADVNRDGHPGGNDGKAARRAAARAEVGPVREYHHDRWTPPPTRPAVVLDPFSGTGTTVLMADVLGRHGIGVDMSADYCRLARWRTTDPGQRAAAMQVDKPEAVSDGQMQLFA